MYILGIAVGAATSLAVLILVIKLIRKATHKEGTWAKYDERQQAARGRGYKYAYFTTLILIAAAMGWYGAAEETGYVIPIPQVLLGIMIAGILVYVSYAIWSDAYIAPNETYRSSVILMAVIAAVNLGIGAVNLRKNGFSVSYINFGVGGMIAVICVEMIIKHLCDKYIGGGDEE